MTRPRPLAALSLLVAASGLAVSIYLTANHYAAVPLVCNLSGFSCERVLTSPYATLPFLYLPTSVAGIAFFTIALGLTSAWALLAKPSSRLLDLALAWASIGVLFVLGLVYIEIVVLGAICLWCSAVHVLAVLNLLILLYSRAARPRAAS